MEKIDKKINKRFKDYAGYSFIEGVIATFIVTAGMIAVIQLMTASLTVMFNSRNQTMATFLAQESVEIVRNIRDNNWAAQIDTFDSTNFPASSMDDCRVDIFSTDILDCNSSSNKRLQKNATSGVFYHNSGSPNSEFQRKIIIVYDTGNRNTANTATVTGVTVWGTSFPGTIDASHCNAGSRCAFASAVLNKWGGMD